MGKYTSEIKKISCQLILSTDKIFKNFWSEFVGKKISFPSFIISIGNEEFEIITRYMDYNSDSITFDKDNLIISYICSVCTTTSGVTYIPLDKICGYSIKWDEISLVVGIWI